MATRKEFPSLFAPPSAPPPDDGRAWSDETPIHYQVREKMLNRILRGEWPPGLSIPTEHELAASYDVSRQTIREAIRALRNEGFLQARRGSGTYVRRSLSEGPLILAHGDLHPQDGRDSRWTRREVRREVRPVGESESVLGRPVGTPVLMVEQVTMRDDVPFALVYSFYVRFTGTQFKGLSKASEQDRIRVGANVLNPYEADVLGDSAHTASLVLEVMRHDGRGSVAQLHRCTFPAPNLTVELSVDAQTPAALLTLLNVGT